MVWILFVWAINRPRPIAILEDHFQYCLGRAYEVAPNKNGFRFKGDVFAMNSTTIELCLSLCPWAKFHHGKGVTKLYTAIDVANDILQFAVITVGNVHDLTAIKNTVSFPPKSIVTFDRAYIDYDWLNELN